MSSDDSMFTPAQKVLLFEITRRVAMRRIRHQNDFVDHFGKQLAKVIKLKDKEAAKALFEEAAKWCQLPFDDGPGAA